MLGRELEIQYNEDHRVIASRDFGGERYGMDFDASGNIIGLTLPDGNRLALKYDDFGRLVEETDPLGRTISYKHHFATPLVTETRFPDGSVWKSRYDSKGDQQLPSATIKDYFEAFKYYSENDAFLEF